VLGHDGFDVTPNLLFQCLTAVGSKRVRFKQVPDAFWNAAHIAPAWERTQRAFRVIVKFLERFGVLTNAILPSDAVLITLAAFFDKFPDASRDPVMAWMLQALRYGRYSAASTTFLGEDLRDIENAPSARDAISSLLKRIRDIQSVSADEFLRDYGDSRFGRLMLFLLVFNRGAIDWDASGDRIAFEGTELERGFAPQFHHVFPRNFLVNKAPLEQIEALANIAIIGPRANIRINDQDPLAYFSKYKICSEKRRQQFIEDDVESMVPENFPIWIGKRAQSLADATNGYLSKLTQTSAATPS